MAHLTLARAIIIIIIIPDANRTAYLSYYLLSR